MAAECLSVASAGNTESAAPCVEEIRARIEQEMGELITWVLSCTSLTFFAFETQLVSKVLALGCLFVQLFLCMRHAQFQAAHGAPEPGYKRLGPHPRWLGTFFGKVRYWRTYWYGKSQGYYPLDVEMGLTGDGFSMLLRSYAVRLATKVSYAQTALLLTFFLGWSPAQESIEDMVLGMGRQTGAWFESAPVPKGDGEVLVIQMDSKATPTATEAELEQRRGPRTPNLHPGSQRHRGRAARQRRGTKQRRKKGDKAQNGKMATIVTMYTLKRSADGTLEGPINKKVYASYAPKRHAVAIARREANKRGFGPETGKLIQIVTDRGDELKVGKQGNRPNTYNTRFPRDLVAPLNEFLNVWRPLLPGHERDEVFTTWTGQPFTSSAISVEFRKTAYAYTRHATNIHLVRDIWATEFLIIGLWTKWLLPLYVAVQAVR